MMSVLSSLIGDGWFSLEKVESNKAEAEWEEQDQAVWPVFVKKFEEESVLVRFPSSPTYRYLSPGEIEISASLGEETTKLIVLNSFEPNVLDQKMGEISARPNVLLINASRPSSSILDLQYFCEEKWFSERVIVSPTHLYIFQTSSPQPITPNHQAFISSFTIDKF